MNPRALEALVPSLWPKGLPGKWHEFLAHVHAPRILLCAHRGATKTTLMRSLAIHDFLSGNKHILYITSTDRKKEEAYASIALRLREEKPIRFVLEDLDRYFMFNEDHIIHDGLRARLSFGSMESRLRGTNIEGRPDLIILDDVLWDSVRTSAKVRERITTLFFSVIEPMGEASTRIIVCGTPLHPEDLLSRLMQTDYLKFMYPVYDSNGDLNFPEVVTREYVESIRSRLLAAGLEFVWHTEYLLQPVLPKEFPFAEKEFKFHSSCAISGVYYPPHTLYRVLAVDHAQGVGGDAFAIVLTGESRDRKILVLYSFANNQLDLKGRSEHLLQVIIKHRPHKLVIERTAESLTFIDYFKQILQSRNIPIEIKTPKPTTKNARIYTHVYANLDRLYFGDHPELLTQLRSFNLREKNNVDDLIDALAYCLQETRPPQYGETPPAPQFLQRVYNTAKGNQERMNWRA